MPVEGELQLNPGPLLRNSKTNLKRLSISICIGIALAAAALGIFVFAKFVSLTFRGLFTPYQSEYHKLSLKNVENRATVVQPLVDRQQTFDLAATVWLRTSQYVPQNHASYGVRETPLYSDIIFRGVHLSDKDLHKTVNFTVPIDLFRRPDLTNYDLRASVVLIPSSPSLLDHMTNYSSYLPTTLYRLPTSPWPIPPGSEYTGETALVRKALESFASSIPLIQFHGIQSQCNLSTSPSETSTSATDQDDDLEHLMASNSKTGPSAKENDRPSSKLEFKIHPPPPILETTKGKDVLETHPYIVTRTQIRVLDEEHIFDLQSYLQEHKRRKNVACGKRVYPRPYQFVCKLPYREAGSYETLLQLDVPNEKTGKNQREWAYAPYFSISRFGFGPKDLLPIPVFRENCTINDQARTDEEPTTIDVSWKVSYSGRSPAKMNFLELTESKRWYSFNTSDAEMIFNQHEVETIHGVMGHKYGQDTHPRRRFVIASLLELLTVIVYCLDLVYWSTRTTTVSISLPGTTLLAMAAFIAVLDKHAAPWLAGQPITMAKWAPAFMVLIVAQLKTITRLEITLHGWIPSFSRRAATRSERASARMESWSTDVAFLLATLAIYYLVAPQRIVLIPAITEKPTPTDAVHNLIPDFVKNAFAMTSVTLQILLNLRSSSFAGKARITAWLLLVQNLLGSLGFIPAVVGIYETRGALTIQDILDVLLVLIMAWQAAVLPLPQDGSYEGHGE